MKNQSEIQIQIQFNSIQLLNTMSQNQPPLEMGMDTETEVE